MNNSQQEDLLTNDSDKADFYHCLKKYQISLKSLKNNYLNESDKRKNQ